MSEIFKELNGFLEKDEKPMWKGQPKTDTHLTTLDLFYVPVSIILMLFALKDFIIDDVDLLGLPFIMVLIYILIGRFFIKYLRKKRTVYYVTNKRVIILDKSRNKIIQEEYINSIKHINKIIRVNGIGTVQFGEPTMIQMIGGNTGLDVIEKPSIYETGELRIPIFYDIEDAEDVCELVNRLKRTSC